MVRCHAKKRRTLVSIAFVLVCAAELLMVAFGVTILLGAMNTKCDETCVYSCVRPAYNYSDFESMSSLPKVSESKTFTYTDYPRENAVLDLMSTTTYRSEKNYPLNSTHFFDELDWDKTYRVKIQIREIQFEIAAYCTAIRDCGEAEGEVDDVTDDTFKNKLVTSVSFKVPFTNVIFDWVVAEYDSSAAQWKDWVWPSCTGCGLGPYSSSIAALDMNPDNLNDFFKGGNWDDGTTDLCLDEKFGGGDSFHEYSKYRPLSFVAEFNSWCCWQKTSIAADPTSGADELGSNASPTYPVAAWTDWSVDSDSSERLQMLTNSIGSFDGLGVESNSMFTYLDGLSGIIQERVYEIFDIVVPYDAGASECKSLYRSFSACETANQQCLNSCNSGVSNEYREAGFALAAAALGLFSAAIMFFLEFCSWKRGEDLVVKDELASSATGAVRMHSPRARRDAE